MLSRTSMEKIASRDDLSQNSKKVVFSLLAEINSSMLAKTYGSNDSIKKLLDGGNYADARVLSEVFGEITNTCKDNAEYIDEILKSLPNEN